MRLLQERINSILNKKKELITRPKDQIKVRSKVRIRRSSKFIPGAVGVVTKIKGDEYIVRFSAKYRGTFSYDELILIKPKKKKKYKPRVKIDEVFGSDGMTISRPSDVWDLTIGHRHNDYQPHHHNSEVHRYTDGSYVFYFELAPSPSGHLSLILSRGLEGGHFTIVSSIVCFNRVEAEREMQRIILALRLR